MLIRIFAFLIPLIWSVSATTEWFGDLRAHLNPARRPAFYDVTYDDSECSSGIQSNVIPEFVYFGEMVATKAMNSYTECLHKCLMTERCKAVNFFESLSTNERGFCELLSESQYDNPRLMRPFRKASYYEKIRCKTNSGGDLDALDTDSEQVDNETSRQISTISNVETVSNTEKPPQNEAGKKATTNPPNIHKVTTSTNSKIPIAERTSVTVEKVLTADKAAVPANKFVSSTALKTNLTETKNEASQEVKISTSAATKSKSADSQPSSQERDGFVMGFREIGRGDTSRILVDETADFSAAPTSTPSTTAADETSAVELATMRMSRDEMLRKLAAKVREFNLKFSRN